MIRRIAKEFAEREIEPIADQIDREAKIPPDMITKMAKARLLGMILPTEYGGAGLAYLTFILALEQIHYPCTACTWIMGDANGIGSLYALFGTEEQKREHIPPICEGRTHPSAGFTEPSTGSDPRMLTTTAVLENGYWVINGTKRFHTKGHLDGPAIVFVKTDGDKLSAIIVPKNIPGYTTSKPWELFGVRGLETVDTYLDNVRVPEKNLLGERGNAYDILLKMVSIMKMVIAIRSVAVGQRALDEAVAYAKRRMTRRGPISDMMGHQWLLAEMASRVEASRWLVYRVSFLIEQGEIAEMEAALAKLFAVQAGTWVANEAFQIHGAYGYTTEYKIERILRAAKQSEIAEGTNEVQRTIAGRALVR